MWLPEASTPRHDRAYLLGDAKRNDVLALSEVLRYGSDSFGDPDYVTVFGLKPADWYARGIRLLGRTAVECTRDALAERIGRAVAAAAGMAPAVQGSVVVDPFAGSANTLFWLARHAHPRRTVGLELDARGGCARRGPGPGPPPHAAASPGDRRFHRAHLLGAQGSACSPGPRERVARSST